MTACVREQTPQHPNSPGVVTDPEVVCRGAYDPIHFNKKGALRAAVVRPKDLIAGELSVWRRDRDPNFGLDGVKGELEKAAADGHELRLILGATAEAIRAIRLEALGQNQRIFCVLDDCRTDEKGGWHPEHATVTLEPVPDVAWQLDTDPLDMAKEGLVALFKQQVLWKSAA